MGKKPVRGTDDRTSLEKFLDEEAAKEGPEFQKKIADRIAAIESGRVRVAVSKKRCHL